MGRDLRFYGLQLAVYAVPALLSILNLAGVDFSNGYLYFSSVIYISTLIGTVVYFLSDINPSLRRFLQGDEELPECNKGFWNRYEYFKKSMWAALIHSALLTGMMWVCFFAFVLNTSSRYKTIQGVSGTTINVYGMGKAVVNGNPENTRLWDAVDIAVPAEEDVVTFITTKRVTIRQTVGNCSESKAIPQAHCTTDANCTAGKIYGMGHGITTGNCLNGTCEVHAWCPIEPIEGKDEVTVEKLEGVGKYTLHIRNFVNFDISDGVWKRYNNSVADNRCIYSKSQIEPCPIFSLESIVEETLNSTEELIELSEKGAIISVHIQYDCWNENDTCLPKYNFALLDPSNSGLANYSYTDVKYPLENKQSRIYMEATGILFLVEVDATIQVLSSLQVLATAAAAFVALKGVNQLTDLAVFILCLCCCCYTPVKSRDLGQPFNGEGDEQTDQLSIGH